MQGSSNQHCINEPLNANYHNSITTYHSNANHNLLIKVVVYQLAYSRKHIVAIIALIQFVVITYVAVVLTIIAPGDYKTRHKFSKFNNGAI